jgi:arginyl-tRNA synthetase
MIDRRLSYVRRLEDFLLQQNPDWATNLVIEQPPSDQKTAEFDLAIPCFHLSKSRRLPPPKCAEDVATQIRDAQEKLGVEKIEVVKGYVNLRFKSEVLSHAVMQRMKDPLMDSAKAWSKETITIDYSSPNVAKPMSIGHLRATVIGQAICNLARSQGYEVIGLNHLGDWGVQFGKLAWAVETWGHEYPLKEQPFENLYKLYVRFHEEAEKNPKLDELGSGYFKKT